MLSQLFASPLSIRTFLATFGLPLGLFDLFYLLLCWSIPSTTFSLLVSSVDLPSKCWFIFLTISDHLLIKITFRTSDSTSLLPKWIEPSHSLIPFCQSPASISLKTESKSRNKENRNYFFHKRVCTWINQIIWGAEPSNSGYLRCWKPPKSALRLGRNQRLPKKPSFSSLLPFSSFRDSPPFILTQFITALTCFHVPYFLSSLNPSSSTLS